MKPQALIMLVVAIGCGIGAVVVANNYMVDSGGGSGVEKKPIVVAAGDIRSGAEVTEELIAMKEYPIDLVPPNAMEDRNLVIGRAVSHDIAAGEVIQEAKLAAEGTKSGLGAVIPPGKRAMSLKIPTEHVVGGFVKVGSHVDIIVNMRSGAGNAGPKSQTFLQDVEVVAINSAMSNAASAGGEGQQIESVTFLVDPDQVELMAIADSMGEVRLSLRSDVDDEEVKTQGKSLDDLVRTSKAGRRDGVDPLMIDEGDSDDGGIFGDGPQQPGQEPAPPTQVAAADPAPANNSDPASIIVPSIGSDDLGEDMTFNSVKMKRLIYRNLDGEPVMEVMLALNDPLVKELEEEGLLDELETGLQSFDPSENLDNNGNSDVPEDDIFIGDDLSTEPAGPSDGNAPF